MVRLHWLDIGGKCAFGDAMKPPINFVQPGWPARLGARVAHLTFHEVLTVIRVGRRVAESLVTNLAAKFSPDREVRKLEEAGGLCTNFSMANLQWEFVADDGKWKLINHRNTRGTSSRESQHGDQTA